MKKYILGICAIMLAVALAWSTSAFKSADPVEYFYEFIGDPAIELEVKDASQYKRVEHACTSDEGPLCGINLPTDTGLGNQPDSQELQAHEVDLWSSAQIEEAGSDFIKMRN